MSARYASEASVVKAIRDYLKTVPDCKCSKRHGTAMGEAGLADLYGSLRGRHFEIEVKSADPSSKPTALQEQRLTEWAAAGAITGVARSVEDARRILRIGVYTSDE